MSQTLTEDLVTANRILAEEDIIRIFGHVSTREPGSDEMLISRAKSPALVTENDIVRMTLDGDIRDDVDDSEMYNENIIHRAIYRRRDDINAIIHHHAHEIMPFTVSDVEIKPMYMAGALFHDGVPKFTEYDDEYGKLIVSEAEANRMAVNLGDKRAQLLESHGANVVGSDLRRVVYLTKRFLINARYQYQAELLGKPVYYTGPPESIESMVNILSKPGGSDRMWEHLAAKVDRAG